MHTHCRSSLLRVITPQGTSMAKMVGFWRTQEDPHLALKCIVCDGAGLLPHEALLSVSRGNAPKTPGSSDRKTWDMLLELVAES